MACERLTRIGFFMHMHNEAYSPELTVYLAGKLNKECSLNIIVPQFVKETDTPQVANALGRAAEKQNS
ncbi:MAG: hypothetical protein ABR502_02135 [Chitinophagaceae bacterium]